MRTSPTSITTEKGLITIYPVEKKTINQVGIVVAQAIVTTEPRHLSETAPLITSKREHEKKRP